MKTMARMATVLIALCCAVPASAADHLDAPGTQTDQAADITDLYAWHTEGGSLVAIVGIAGAGTTTDTATLDPEVLYGVHIDNDGDNVADIDIWVRYAQNADGEWGMQITNLPGADGVLVGPVGEMWGAPGVRGWTGVSDDPFFFDFQGFQDTLLSATLSFDSSRDFFTNLNITAIVLEMDLDAASGGSETFQVWATTSRL